jgi:hypothetical protein
MKYLATINGVEHSIDLPLHNTREARLQIEQYVNALGIDWDKSTIFVDNYPKDTSYLEKHPGFRIIEVFIKRQSGNSTNQQMLDALNEINNWLVCATISTPEDMANSFPYMQELAQKAIDRANKKFCHE